MTEIVQRGALVGILDIDRNLGSTPIVIDTIKKTIHVNVAVMLLDPIIAPNYIKEESITICKGSIDVVRHNQQEEQITDSFLDEWVEIARKAMEYFRFESVECIWREKHPHDIVLCFSGANLNDLGIIAKFVYDLAKFISNSLNT